MFGCHSFQILLPSLLIIVISAFHLLKQTWFQLGRKSSQIERRLRSQLELDDFDQDVIIGDVAKMGQQNIVVSDGTVDRGFTVDNSGSISTTKENAVNVQTLERCFTEGIDRKMGNIVDTVEDRIQNAILTAIDNIITKNWASSQVNKCVYWTGCCYRHGKSGAWLAHRDCCPIWEGIRKKKRISWIKREWWDSNKHFRRGKWLFSPRNTFWPAATHSSHSEKAIGESGGHLKAKWSRYNCDTTKLIVLLRKK